MEHIQQLLLPIVRTVNAYLADYVLIALLVGAGLFFSLKTRFVQIRYFGSGLKQFLGGKNSAHEVSYLNVFHG